MLPEVPQSSLLAFVPKSKCFSSFPTSPSTCAGTPWRIVLYNDECLPTCLITELYSQGILISISWIFSSMLRNAAIIQNCQARGWMAVSRGASSWEGGTWGLARVHARIPFPVTGDRGSFRSQDFPLTQGLLNYTNLNFWKRIRFNYTIAIECHSWGTHGRELNLAKSC